MLRTQIVPTSTSSSARCYKISFAIVISPKSVMPGEQPSLEPESHGNSTFHFGFLQDDAKARLAEILISIAGIKTLILDPSLSGPLSLLVETSFLKVFAFFFIEDSCANVEGIQHHSVEKIFWLEQTQFVPPTQNIVFLCRPTARIINIMIGHVKRILSEERKCTYTLILVPRLSKLISHALEEEGIMGDLSIISFPLYFIPLEDDLMSLENCDTFREIWIDGDETSLQYSAEALIALQETLGVFPKIVGKGDCAARLASLFRRMSSKKSRDRGLLDPAANSVAGLIILDRKVDMITPMLTQMTYEGLIDETIGIKNSYTEIPASLFEASASSSSHESSTALSERGSGRLIQSAQEKNKKYRLHSASDSIFAAIRDYTFPHIGRELNKIARRLNEDYERRLRLENVTQLKDFVSRLGNLQNEHQSLRIHTSLSESLVSHVRSEQFNRILEIQQNLLSCENLPSQISAIEDIISRKVDMKLALRLISLANLTTAGIKTKSYDVLKLCVLQTYGYHFLPLFTNLELAGLGLSASSKSQYSSIRKHFQLLVEESSDAAIEEDISYAYAGYVPLSVRLVQYVLQKSRSWATVKEEKSGKRTNVTSSDHTLLQWNGLEDVLSLVPGEAFAINCQDGKDGQILESSAPGHTRIIIIYYLGGCTYAEIAALRVLGRMMKGSRLVIATSSVISGSNVIDSICNAPGGQKQNSGAVL